MTHIKEKNPVILNLTNQVVQTQTANALLAIGASPIMSFEIREINDILRFTDSINLNIGTLTERQIALFNHTAKIANEKDIPIVLDPVGAGATQLRTDTTLSLLQRYNISILKGNATEILSLYQSTQAMNTIDSRINPSDALIAAQALSEKYDVTVVVSGDIDDCVHKTKSESITGGHPLMSKVTGMGCIASALCAAALTVSPSSFEAGIKGMKMMARSAEKAMLTAKGPGTFIPAFTDALYTLTD